MTLHFLIASGPNRGDVRCGVVVSWQDRRKRTTTARRAVTCKRCLTLVARDRWKEKSERAKGRG